MNKSNSKQDLRKIRIITGICQRKPHGQEQKAGALKFRALPSSSVLRFRLPWMTIERGMDWGQIMLGTCYIARDLSTSRFGDSIRGGEKSRRAYWTTSLLLHCRLKIG